MPGLVVAAIVLARKNINASRGDRRAAMRAAAVVFVVSLVGWVLGTTHFADVNREVVRILCPDRRRPVSSRADVADLPRSGTVRETVLTR